MEDIKVVIQPLTEHYIDVYVEILLANFDDKSGVIFKGIPKRISNQIMIDLISLVKNSYGDIEGFYLAGIQQEQKLNLVGVFSLMHRKLQIKEKQYQDLQWKILRKYLNFWKSLKIGLMIDYLSAKKLNDDELYIDSISVKEEFRGKGVGSKILDFVEMLVLSLELNNISLYVSCKNKTAFDLYERKGFLVIKKKKSWISKRLLQIPYFFLMIKRFKP